MILGRHLSGQRNCTPSRDADATVISRIFRICGSSRQIRPYGVGLSLQVAGQPAMRRTPRSTAGNRVVTPRSRQPHYAHWPVTSPAQNSDMNSGIRRRRRFPATRGGRPAHRGLSATFRNASVTSDAVVSRRTGTVRTSTRWTTGRRTGGRHAVRVPTARNQPRRGLVARERLDGQLGDGARADSQDIVASGYAAYAIVQPS